MRRNSVLILVLVIVGAIIGLASARPDSIDKAMFFRTGECSALQSWRLKRHKVLPINYEKIREIPKASDQIQVVIETASEWPCLPYGHWFRIGFDPYHKDIILNDDVLSSYKQDRETVWIYLQYEYKDLQATSLGISVIVYFKGRPERIFIPYESITWFDDQNHGFLLKPWADDPGNERIE
ncbi:MAG: ClpXP protease specificity-enhancing factor SspB [Alphaproteobacteria bacterium]